MRVGAEPTDAAGDAAGRAIQRQLVWRWSDGQGALATTSSISTGPATMANRSGHRGALWGHGHRDAASGAGWPAGGRRSIALAE